MLAALRLARVTIHLLIGFDAVLAFGRLPQPTRRAFVRWWARALLSTLGVRLHVTGRILQTPALIVANHISWLDVIVLLAAQPATFVCKSEVAGWPGIGWLLKRAGTVFIRRGSFRDVWRVNMALRARFQANESVAAFPEGTTTTGGELLPFRAALFQPAVDRHIPIQPVAIAYSSPRAAYVGETSFLESLLSICAARDLAVHLTALPPFPPGLSRRQAAATARAVISYARAAPFPCTSRATPGSASPQGPLGQPGR